MPDRFPYSHRHNDRELCLHAETMRLFSDGGTHICQAWHVLRNDGGSYGLLEARGRSPAEAVYKFWQMIDDLGEFQA